MLSVMRLDRGLGISVKEATQRAVGYEASYEQR
jgi:hypothetical protein